MSKLRIVPYRDLKSVVEACGFVCVWVRREGSHNAFRHPDGRVPVVPDHGSDPIVRPLLRKILRDLNLSVDECNNLLNR